MKTAILFSGLIALPLSALSQTNCPVLIGKVNPKVTQSWSRVGRSLGTNNEVDRRHLANTPDFSVEFKNNSGKDIRGLKIHVAYFDATEDLHLIPISWNANKTIKSGEDKTINWSNELYKGDETDVGWIAVIEKVLFEDGTKWEYSADTPSCYGEYWVSKKHPRLTALPDRQKFQQASDGKEETGKAGMAK